MAKSLLTAKIPLHILVESLNVLATNLICANEQRFAKPKPKAKNQKALNKRNFFFGLPKSKLDRNSTL